MTQLTRKQIVQSWKERLTKHGQTQGFFITLDTNKTSIAENNARVQNRMIDLTPKVRLFLKRLDEYCYRRRLNMKEEHLHLVTPFSYEVGTGNGLLHFHILAAHNGSVKRSAEEVEMWAHHNWEKLCGSRMPSTSVHVRDIGNIEKTLRYMTKQTNKLSWNSGELNMQ